MRKEEIQFVESLMILIKWRRLIIINFFLFCIVTAIISLLLKPWYTSMTTLLPPEEEGLGAFSLLSLAENLPFNVPTLPGMTGPSDLYIAILRSRNVKEGVIKKLDLMRVYKAPDLEETVRKLTNRTKLDKSEEGIIIIKATDHFRERAAAIANTYVDEVERVNKDIRISRAKSTREFIAVRVNETENLLLNAAETLKDFQEQYKAIALEQQTRVAIETAASLRAQIISQQIQYNLLRQNFDETHGEVRKTESHLIELRRELGKIENGGGVPTDEYLIPFSEIPDLSLKLAFLTKDFEVQKILYQLLMQQYEQAKIQEAKDTPTIQVLDEAIPSIKRSKPKRTIMVVLAGILSFFVSGFYIFTHEYFQRLKMKDTALYDKFAISLSILKRDFLHIKQLFRLRK